MIRKKCLYLFSAFIVFFAFCSLSQEKTILTIKDAVSKALSSNPRLISANLEVAAAKMRKEQSYASHFGELNFVANYNQFERNRIVVPMAEDLFKIPQLGMSQLPWDRNQIHYGLTFTLPLLAGGALYEGDKIAKLLENCAKNNALFTKEEIIYNVKSAYRNALALRHSLDAAEFLMNALHKDFEDYQTKYNLGQAAKVDLQKVEFSLEASKAQYDDIMAQYKNSLNLLSAFLGEEPGENYYELIDIEEVPEMPVFNEDEKDYLLQRKDFLAQKDITKAAEHKKHLAFSAFSPQIVLQGTYLKNSAPSLSEDLYTREWLVALKIPIFNGLKRARAVQESSINLEIAKEKEKAKKLEIETQILDAREKIKASESLYKSGVVQRELGKEIAKIEKLKLEQGGGKLEDYLYARAQELQGEASYWRGLYLLQNALDYYKFVVGKGENNE